MPWVTAATAATIHNNSLQPQMGCCRLVSLLDKCAYSFSAHSLEIAECCLADRHIGMHPSSYGHTLSLLPVVLSPCHTSTQSHSHPQLHSPPSLRTPYRCLQLKADWLPPGFPLTRFPSRGPGCFPSRGPGCFPSRGPGCLAPLCVWHSTARRSIQPPSAACVGTS